MRESEERVFITAPEGLTPLRITVGALVGVVVVAEHSQPVVAQEVGDTSDCSYGRALEWVTDSNRDGQPGPSRGEFQCALKPGCNEHPFIKRSAIATEMVERMTSEQSLQMTIAWNEYGRIVACEGDPIPTSDDYQAFLDATPWFVRFLSENTWIGAELQNNPQYANEPWAVLYRRIHGTQPETEASTPDVDEEDEPIEGQPAPAETPEVDDLGSETEASTPEVDEEDEPIEGQPAPAETPEVDDLGSETEASTPEVDEEDEPIEGQPAPAETPEVDDLGSETEASTPEVDEEDEPIEGQPAPAETPEVDDLGSETEASTPEVDEEDEPIEGQPAPAETPEVDDLGSETEASTPGITREALTEHSPQDNSPDSSLPEVIGGVVVGVVAVTALVTYLRKHRRSS